MANFMVSGELRARLEEMASGCVKPAGTVLFRRGDDVSGVFLIEKGKVKLTLEGAPGVRKLGPGAVLGLPATLSGSPYSLTAEVTQDAQLGFISREAMLDFLRANPLLCFQVMQVLSEELWEMRAAIGSHARWSMERPKTYRAALRIPPRTAKSIHLRRIPKS